MGDIVNQIFGGGQQQNPDQTGGITPEQAALAEYGFGGSLLPAMGQFPQGASLSTMARQAATGANWGKALEEANLSDANQQTQQEITNAQNAQSAQSSSQLNTALGKLIGSGLGSQPSTTATANP